MVTRPFNCSERAGFFYLSGMNWNDYPNFKKAEFDCKHTGKNEMEPQFMEMLQRLRTSYGKPMRVTSGYRDRTHPIEARKPNGGGAHTTGRAVDIAVEGEDAYALVTMAVALGFTGIGVSQRAGQPRFIHLDTLGRRAIWSY